MQATIMDELQRKLRKTEEDLVDFEVSGTKFREQRSLLLKHPESKLARIFSDNYAMVDKAGELSLDRSVNGFTMMLDLLKSDGEVFPKDPNLQDLMLDELSFFELDNFYKLQVNQTNFPLTSITEQPQDIVTDKEDEEIVASEEEEKQELEEEPIFKRHATKL